MHTSIRRTVFATTAIIGLGAFAAVAAQPGAGDPTAARPSAAAPNGQATTGARGTEARIEQRITDLHTRLLISTAQQPQWDRFSDVMRENARDTSETFQHRAQAMSAMTAAENMQSYAKVTAEYAQHMQKLVPTFQALYDTMSDSQKRTADQVFRDDANHGDRSHRS
jgi:periplasmic protein CpxP/Spy